MTILVNGDTSLEPDENFFVNLTNPASSEEVTIVDSQGVGTITDPELGFPVAAPPGLLSWWTGDGHAQDIVGTNDGALVAGATFGAGHSKQAFSFDGVDDFLQAPTTTLPTGNSDRTLELWVKADTFPAQFVDEAFFAGYGAFGSFTRLENAR